MDIHNKHIKKINLNLISQDIVEQIDSRNSKEKKQRLTLQEVFN